MAILFSREATEGPGPSLRFSPRGLPETEDFPATLRAASDCGGELCVLSTHSSCQKGPPLSLRGDGQAGRWVLTMGAREEAAAAAGRGPHVPGAGRRRVQRGRGRRVVTDRRAGALHWAGPRSYCRKQVCLQRVLNRKIRKPLRGFQGGASFLPRMRVDFTQHIFSAH